MVFPRLCSVSRSNVHGNSLKKILFGASTKTAYFRLLAGPIGMIMFDSMHDLSSNSRRAYVLMCLALNLLDQRTFTEEQLADAVVSFFTAAAFVECFLDSSLLTGRFHAMLHSISRIFGCGPLGKQMQLVSHFDHNSDTCVQASLICTRRRASGLSLSHLG